MYHQLCLTEHRSYVVTSMGKGVKRGDSLRLASKQAHVGKARFNISSPKAAANIIFTEVSTLAVQILRENCNSHVSFQL